MSSRKKKKTAGKAAARPRFTGWLTSDAEEIERRRLRGREERFRVSLLTPDERYYGGYEVASPEGPAYRVEMRALDEPLNTCSCPDHRINGLGTCKHVEAVRHRLERAGKRRFREAAAAGSPCIEIFLDRRSEQVRVLWPRRGSSRASIRARLAPFFEEGTLAGDPLDGLPALERAVAAAPASARRRVRISGELAPWLADRDRRAERRRARQHFEAAVASGEARLDFLQRPLYPYQQEGMLHLAFTGRAMLADDMGLGKTVQAIAACELMQRQFGVRRVLVVAPASLKAEWEEQIAAFTSRPVLRIQGPRAQRLRQYARDAFFYLANYEQIRPDLAALNDTLAPDVVILDEAQRIKNWQTKTAAAVKGLQSPYAFVLTGTPVENRIDEIYSIAQFLDPQLFGPLFRFNREFYQLDERGQPVGYKNLDKLHARLRPLMLRRRKEDVEGELPGRTVNTHFVAMHPEQTVRYEEHSAQVARLASTARRRPLTAREMERLQRHLACMRMLCDTPYILDQDCRVCPKLEELVTVLRELAAAGHKIIVFSEWQRMLDLVAERAERLRIGYAWHTGRVAQSKRRAEIRRFKDDPDCRLFLSTDSGAAGLNLQVADVVVNCDLPWNPARLEQRIARAWRKHQRRSVQVLNLVTEDSIEHRMLHLLESKRALAAGVVDGSGESSMALPSGRAALLERLDALMPAGEGGATAESEDPIAALCDRWLGRFGDRLARVELHGEGEGQTLLVVARGADDGLAGALAAELPDAGGAEPQLKVIDETVHAAIEDLMRAGILAASSQEARLLHPPAAAAATGADAARARRLAQARAELARAEHRRRMASVLAQGGFAQEALAPMREAVDTAVQALAGLNGAGGEGPPSLEHIEAALVRPGTLPAEAPAVVARLRELDASMPADQAGELLAQAEQLVAAAAAAIAGDRDH